MDKTSFHLLILTPYGHYFEGDVAFLEVHSEEYNLGILPGHAPLVSTLAISKMTIKAMGKVSVYAIGGGVINVEKERVTLILNSVERDDEIDVARAQEAKKRAEDRLKETGVRLLCLSSSGWHGEHFPVNSNFTRLVIL